MKQAWIIIDEDPEFPSDGEAKIVLVEPDRWAGNRIIPIVYDEITEEKDF